MAQGPFVRALQRIADALGVLLPPQRALRFVAPFTVRDVPEETLRGAAGSGEVTGYTEVGVDGALLPVGGVMGVAPIIVDSPSPGIRRVAISDATTSGAGSMSSDDKTKLDGLAYRLVPYVITFDRDEDLVDLDAGVISLQKNIGGAQAGRYLVGFSSGGSGGIVFANGAGATYTLNAGWGGTPNLLVLNRNVGSAGGVFPLDGNGTSNCSGYELGALQMVAVLSSNQDLNTATAGFISVTALVLEPL
jgi:hypothetical protein